MIESIRCVDRCNIVDTSNPFIIDVYAWYKNFTKCLYENMTTAKPFLMFVALFLLLLLLLFTSILFYFAAIKISSEKIFSILELIDI